MLLPTLFPGISVDEIRTLSRLHRDIFRERYIDQVQPFPGALDFLKKVYDSGRKITLASSATMDEVMLYVGLLNAQSFINAVVCADDVAKSKPAADIFLKALETITPISAMECIAIGDTPYDVQSAGKCGIQTIALLSGGFSRMALSSAGATEIYGDIGDLSRKWSDSPLSR